MKLLKHLKERITPEVKYIILLFVATRIILTIVGVSSRSIFSPLYDGSYPFVYSNHLWLDIWGVWDSGWYLDIAANGYSPNPANLSAACCGQANYAFFPLYPLLMRILGTFTGDYYVAGIVISNVSLIVTSLFLNKLVKLESSRAVARKSIKYLFFFPTAFILSGVFAESLLLALIIMCFFYAKKKNWLLVGVLGLLLSLTKPVGAIVILPLFYEYLKSKNFKLEKIQLDSLYLLLIPLGTVAFITYTYFLTGDFLAYVHIQQSAWGAQLSNPARILLNSFLTKNPAFAFFGLYTITAMFLLFFYYKRVGITYLITGILFIIVPLMSGQVVFISMPRHTLAVFPLYILFAKLSKNIYFDKIATVFLASFQIALMVYWSNGIFIV